MHQNYLMGNPWSAVAVPRTAGSKVNAGRSINLTQWDFIEVQLNMWPAPTSLATTTVYATTEKHRQNNLDSTRTGRKNPGLQATQRLPCESTSSALAIPACVAWAK